MTSVYKMADILPVKMSNYQRVKQWVTFSRQWHLTNGEWQDPFKLGVKVAAILDGRNKPIYTPRADCGDHVVIYNCYDVAMRAFDWRRINYYFDNEHPRGKSYIDAWEIHESDPCRVMWMAVYAELRGPFNTRKQNVNRLHLFPDDKIPEEILKNISNQMAQMSKQPKSTEDYSESEKQEFPTLFDW